VGSNPHLDIQFLYPLELYPQKTSDVEAAPTPTKSQEVVNHQRDSEKSQADTRGTRPVRAATVEAKRRVSEWISKLTDSV